MTEAGTRVGKYVAAVLADMVPMRWCRFCKAETRQLISPKNEHDRACTVCWRRQKDGGRLRIEDGDQRVERSSTIPPPPPPVCEYALKSDIDDVRRMVEELRLQVYALEEHLESQSKTVADCSHHHTLYK